MLISNHYKTRKCIANSFVRKMDDTTVISLFTYVFVFVLICPNGQELLDFRLPWNEANRRCNLSLKTENYTIPPGLTVWIRKRRFFTNWMTIEGCHRYILYESQSSIVQIEENNLVFECQKECSKQFQSVHNRFGMKIKDNNTDCICDTPNTTPNFGQFIGTCKPVSCRPNEGSSVDICGDDGLVEYNEIYREQEMFSGPGECGAFRRIGNNSFESLALSCFEEHGYLQELAGAKQYSAIITPKRSWKHTILNVSSSNKISKNVRSHSNWNDISLEEWPLNTTLWVAVTRRTIHLQCNDDSVCNSGSYYCAAVHVNPNGTITEKLFDCSTTTLPALCTQGSIMSIASGDSRSVDNTTEENTGPPTEPSAVNNGRIIIIVASLAVLILAVTLAMFFLLRRYKKKQEAQESEANAETRPTSIYYSEIHSVKSMKMKRSREDAIMNETDFDDGEYDEIGRDGNRRDISVGDETYSHARKPKEFNSNEHYSTSDSVKHIYDHAHGKTST